MTALLQVDKVSKKFGGLKALTDLSLRCDQNEVVGLIGPNGAGKSTFFNVVTGVYGPDHGDVRFRGERVNGYSSHKIVAAGIARTFQNLRLFHGMTALENVMVARHCRTGAELGAALFRTPTFRREEKEICDAGREALEFVGLLAAGNELAKNLSYGNQRRLEIARAMCTDPLLLCLDEPAAGLNPRESAELNALLRFIRDKHGISVLLIEHDMGVVMEISDHIVVLDYGQKISDGTASFVRTDPRVVAAYLGVEDEDVAAVEREVAG